MTIINNIFLAKISNKQKKVCEQRNERKLKEMLTHGACNCNGKVAVLNGRVRGNCYSGNLEVIICGTCTEIKNVMRL